MLGERWHGDGLALRARLGVQLQETKFPEKLRGPRGDHALPQLLPARAAASTRPSALVAAPGEGGRLGEGTLSGGQKQRLSLACALVGDPELLFLDEPTTGLDPQSRRQTWEIVEGLKARGRTVLLTTHYMEEAARLCDRVAIVDHGQGDRARHAPGADRLAGRGARGRVLGGGGSDAPSTEALAALPSVEGVAREDGALAPHGARGAPDGAGAARRPWPRRAQPASHLTTHHATLEDVFVALTGRTPAR